jgi:hypothetical protein
MGAAPAGGELTWLRALGRLWVSVRAHYGALPLARLDGDRRRREIAARIHVPGRTDQGFKTPRRSAERRCRVPLFPGDPGDTPRLVTMRLSALPPPSVLPEGHPEPPLHAKTFAGSDNACPNKGGHTSICKMSIQTTYWRRQNGNRWKPGALAFTSPVAGGRCLEFDIPRHFFLAPDESAKNSRH